MTTEDQQLADEFFQRISELDPDAPFELMLYFMDRFMHKDIDAALYLMEGLTRVSAALKSSEAKGYLENEWKELRPILKKRLLKQFSQS